jgi:ABC-type sugar transport system, permease component
LVNSFKDKTEANKIGFLLPAKYHIIENYARVFVEGEVPKTFFNGMFMSCTVAICSVIITAMAGYYTARSRRKTASFFYNYFISGIIIPISIVPTYYMLLKTHLTQTYQGFILIFITYCIPLGVFLYTGFIKTIPRELDEAAIVDGSGQFMVFTKIIFPLLLPVTITLAVLNFLTVWNDVVGQIYFLDSKKWMMGMGVYSFMGKYSTNWHLVFADVLTVMVPTIILYLIGQKYIITGMTAGAVKG